jgi:hypothetical protein
MADLLDIATMFVDGEGTVGALFHKGKGQQDVGEPSGERWECREHLDKHRRNHRLRCNEEVAIADRPPRPPTKNGGDHFQKLMNSSCQKHDFPVRHKLQECELMNHFISKLPAKKVRLEEPAKLAEQEVPTEDFLKPKGCPMIFSGAEAYDDKRRIKAEHREVHVVEPTIPCNLWWFEFSIIFISHDHHYSIPHPEAYPLVIEPVVGSKRLTKVLMDMGSGLNIMYIETFDRLGIASSTVRPSTAPFHGIIPDHQAYPLGRITLSVTFDDHTNFRTEWLQFEVVYFPGSYNAILERPCYAKFMVVPNYTYLKLKMPGPRGIITTSASIKTAYTCDRANCELASTMIGLQEHISKDHGDKPDTPSNIADVAKHARIGA